MNKSQITAIMTPEFTQKLAALESAQEVQAALESKGLELSLEEIHKLRDLLQNHTSGPGELSEQELESVSGGGLFVTLAELFLDGYDAVDRWTNSRW